MTCFSCIYCFYLILGKFNLWTGGSLSIAFIVYKGLFSLFNFSVLCSSTGLFSANIWILRGGYDKSFLLINLEINAFSTLLSISPFRILFSRLMKLLSPLCHISSVNCAILKFLHESKLRYPPLDDALA